MLCQSIMHVHYNAPALWNSITQVCYKALALYKIEKIDSRHEKYEPL